MPGCDPLIGELAVKMIPINLGRFVTRTSRGKALISSIKDLSDENYHKDVINGMLKELSKVEYEHVDDLSAILSPDLVVSIASESNTTVVRKMSQFVCLCFRNFYDEKKDDLIKALLAKKLYGIITELMNSGYDNYVLANVSKETCVELLDYFLKNDKKDFANRLISRNFQDESLKAMLASLKQPEHLMLLLPVFPRTVQFRDNLTIDQLKAYLSQVIACKNSKEKWERIMEIFERFSSNQESIDIFLKTILDTVKIGEIPEEYIGPLLAPNLSSNEVFKFIFKELTEDQYKALISYILNQHLAKFFFFDILEIVANTKDTSLETRLERILPLMEVIGNEYIYDLESSFYFNLTKVVKILRSSSSDKSNESLNLFDRVQHYSEEQATRLVTYLDELCPVAEQRVFIIEAMSKVVYSFNLGYGYISQILKTKDKEKIKIAFNAFWPIYVGGGFVDARGKSFFPFLLPEIKTEDVLRYVFETVKESLPEKEQEETIATFINGIQTDTDFDGYPSEQHLKVGFAKDAIETIWKEIKAK